MSGAIRREAIPIGRRRLRVRRLAALESFQMRSAILALPFLLWMPECLSACQCLVSFPVCQEVGASSKVFVGTVKSVDPPFLDPWRTGTAAIPADSIDRMQQHPSPEALARLKADYLHMLGDLPTPARRELEAATTYQEVEEAFHAITAQGRRARFRVGRMYHEANDPDDGNDKDDAAPGAELDLDVWTGVDDCGISFQVGETYVVYAAEDEQSGRLQTSVCSRTKRLSDAGADFAYLHIFSTGGKMASRIEGVVTIRPAQSPQSASPANPAAARSTLANPTPPNPPPATSTPPNPTPPTSTEPNPVSPKPPLGNSTPPSPTPPNPTSEEAVVVGLSGSGVTRYVRAEPDGRFVFDGLAAGKYELSVYDQAFPRQVIRLAGPQAVQVAQRGCAAAVLEVQRKH